MKSRNGFLLIEILIYLSLSVMLVSLACGVFFQLYTKFVAVALVQKNGQLYGALQVLRRDLTGAPRDIHQYTSKGAIPEQASTDGSVLSYPYKDVIITWRWNKHKKRLMRRVNYIAKQTYDSVTILDNVDDFSLVPQQVQGNSKQGDSAQRKNLTFILHMAHKGRIIDGKIVTKNRTLLNGLMRSK